MRILIVHSFYRSAVPSGENTMVIAHAEALQRAGHEVLVAARHTDDGQTSRLYNVLTAATVATGIGPSPQSEIERFRPEVIHVHNLFPNYGRRWIAQTQAPIVHTLHNFRPLCIASTLFRDRAVCTLCPDGKRWSGLVYGCYHGSRLRSLPPAIASRRGARNDPLLTRATALVALSETARLVYEAAGIPRDKLVCIPNFLPEPLPPRNDDSKTDAPWLFVGRLSVEKGVDRLVEEWPADIPLRIVGAGPLERELASAARGKMIEMVRFSARQEVLRFMRTSVGLVFPSRWFEGFPVVYLEALSAGLPVLAFPPSAVADFVASDGTGLVATWSEPLRPTLERARSVFASLRAHCRTVLETHYTERVVVDQLTALYSKVILS